MAILLTLKGGQRMVIGGDLIKAINLTDGSNLTRAWFSTGESNDFIESPEVIYEKLKEWKTTAPSNSHHP